MVILQYFAQVSLISSPRGRIRTVLAYVMNTLNLPQCALAQKFAFLGEFARHYHLSICFNLRKENLS